MGHPADRVPIFGKQVRIELTSVIGGNVDIARIRQCARKRWHCRGTLIGDGRRGNRRQHDQADRHERQITSYKRLC